MEHYKVTSDVALQLNASGWEENPIAAGVSVSSRDDAIDEYRRTVYQLYVAEGQFLDADFHGDASEYTVEQLDKPLSW